MNILILAETHHGTFRKSALEAATYARKIASTVSGKVLALTYGIEADHAASLGEYGVDEVLLLSGEPDPLGLTEAMAHAVKEKNIDLAVLAYNIVGRHVAPRLSARLEAGLISGAIELPQWQNGTMLVRKNVFSGKAIATVECSTPLKILAFAPNSTQPEKSPVHTAVVSYAPPLPVSRIHKVEVREKKGEVSLPDAEIVVSAGRGLKGPENWGIVEDLARALGAATACSRPVADVGWRPHHEHVGQTGLTIRPNLYIAIGISGAIQHLAGVNQSKVIVVINKDPEAPFFKAADYGIVGDAFEVVPKITEAVRKLKAST
ncbi:MAG: electron transfer flavoprotein subunit alpha/FixB family protein [Flavobacteriales bacterium]|nr:electron transfer flavoprotein subunit alpha/FixB family protein [Flavobacteriales bacterium]MCX7767431.1 electron transfer flavoprotein subunit alpha/FixB family protein [Flavobacteriales bacterium]MDW8410055.1 electron transfer flavoprotein subunit alpha/FixB family protein [Flavobacteriales bacterium]